MKHLLLTIIVCMSTPILSNPDAPSDFLAEPEVQKKIDRAQKLVHEAAQFFDDHTFGKACRDFETDPKWKDGEFKIFIFGVDGICYLYGDELDPLWKNFKDVAKTRDARGISILGEPFIENMVEIARKGGWMSYEWNYATNYSYVQMVTKEGNDYVIGTGFYPESPRFLTMELVKRATRLAVKQGAEEAFRQINNTAGGTFIKGDLYLWAYDLEGNAFAHGRNIAVVGQNRLNWKDSTGQLRNKIMIDLIKQKGSGWISYEEDGLPKFAYVEGFTDPRTGKQYIIGGGYYPNMTDDKVVSFVKRAVNYLKAEGPTVAMRDFTSYAGNFIKGPMRLISLNLEGTVLADAQNPIFIGQNVINTRDPEGKYVFKELLDEVNKHGRAWVTFFDNNMYKSLYAELVEVPDGKYIVGAGYWPASKEYTAQSLVEKAVTHLEDNTLPLALEDFIDAGSDYLRGDLFIAVYQDDGICLAYGFNKERIWFDANTVLDKRGYPVMEGIIDTAKRGGGWVEYTKNKRRYRVYTKEVRKPIVERPVLAKVSELVAKTEVIQQNGRAVVEQEVELEKKLHDSYIIVVGYYP